MAGDGTVLKPSSHRKDTLGKALQSSGMKYFSLKDVEAKPTLRHISFNNIFNIYLFNISSYLFFKTLVPTFFRVDVLKGRHDTR